MSPDDRATQCIGVLVEAMHQGCTGKQTVALLRASIVSEIQCAAMQAREQEREAFKAKLLPIMEGLAQDPEGDLSNYGYEYLKATIEGRPFEFYRRPDPLGGPFKTQLEST